MHRRSAGRNARRSGEVLPTGWDVVFKRRLQLWGRSGFGSLRVDVGIALRDGEARNSCQEPSVSELVFILE